MSAARDLQDLLDQVAETPGWRITRTGNGHCILPADSSATQIFLRTSGGNHELQLTELRRRLRTANFPFRNGNSLPPRSPVQEPRMASTPVPASKPVEQPPEKSTFQLVTECISRISDELATLETLFARIKADGADVERARAAIRALLPS